MYFGLGFLIACLLALIILPLVHARAVRLTTRRIEDAAPISVAEIQADKDQLRAEFAMSTRRLEMSVEQLKAKTTGQLAELGKKTETISKLKAELGEKTALVAALEARDKAIKEQLRTSEEELNLKTSALRETDRQLTEKLTELEKTISDRDENSMTKDSQRIEIIALKTQVATLRDQAGELEREVKITSERLAREQADAAAAAKALEEERGRVGKLDERIGQLEHQLAGQVAEAQMLERRISELEATLAVQTQQLDMIRTERDQLRADLEAAYRLENDLREEMAASGRDHASAAESIRAEKTLAEAQLERAREDRTKLQRELAALKREAETTWAAERVENALLRERINDVAAEVARLTTTLEGPGSPIETILAADDIGYSGMRNGSANGRSGSQPRSGGTLADRIRALQSRASRMPAG
jgi:chromosome segregation ATPase